VRGNVGRRTDQVDKDLAGTLCIFALLSQSQQSRGDDDAYCK